MAKKTNNQVVETPAVEEIANTGDEFIQKELTKFNIADAVIEEWKQTYGSLKISDPNNKEEYETLNQGRVFVKKKRIEVEKVGKGLRANAIKFQKAVLEEERRIIALIDPLETYLEEEKKRIDDIKEEEKRLKAEKEQVLLQQRAVSLVKMGMEFTGDAYILGEIRISVMSIKTSDDFVWTTLLAGVEKRFKEQEAIRIEEEKAKEAAAQAAKQLAEENLAKQESLRKQEEELKAKQAALEAAEQKQKEQAAQLEKDRQEAIVRAKDELLKSRKASLFALGFSQQNQRLSFKDLHFTEGEIAGCTDIEWTDKLQITTNNVAHIKEVIEKQRIQELEKVKSEAAEAERKRLEKVAEEAKIEEQKQLNEKNRLAALAPDINKLNTFLKALADVPVPEFSTDGYQEYGKTLDPMRKQFLTHVFSKKPV